MKIHTTDWICKHCDNDMDDLLGNELWISADEIFEQINIIITDSVNGANMRARMMFLQDELKKVIKNEE